MKITKAWFFRDDLYYKSGKSTYRVTYSRIKKVK